eukprot:12924484-Prorocentrum_lima.AAC.1
MRKVEQGIPLEWLEWHPPAKGQRQSCKKKQAAQPRGLGPRLNIGLKEVCCREQKSSQRLLEPEKERELDPGLVVVGT